jgi:hypothetical protein
MKKVETDEKMEVKKEKKKIGKRLLLFKMFIELLHYYVMAQSQWAHYNTV